MKKIALLFIILVLVSCGASKSSKKPLFEVLAERADGGAKIEFFEIISEPKEFIMIKNDPELKNKVKPNDIDTANFLILSMGEKSTGGYSIGIESAVETDKNIIITVKETAPAPGGMVTDAFTTPFCVVKINSKKEIIIK